MNRDLSRRVTSIWTGLVFWLPLVFFLIRIGDFIYLKGANFSDLTISHLPNLLYLREALIEYRTIPLWSPAILGGYPFFANPLSGLWYPPGWPAVVWPAPWTFNLLAGLHLVFGAYGMGRLLEGLGLRREAQCFGGLAFGMLPKLLTHYAAGHITLIYAVVWTPWLLLAQRRPLRGWIRPGILLAVIFLADPRWAAYAGLLWLAWVAVETKRAGEWTRKTAPDAGIALLLSGPLLLPLIETTHLSTRAALTSAETMAFSLHPLRSFSLFFSTTSAEWQLYPGAAVLALAIGAAAIPEIRKRTGFWLIAAVLSLLFAMGEHIPLLRLWASLPLVGILRVPARALFVCGFALAAAAAFSVHAVLASPPDSSARRRWNLLLAALAAVWIAIGSVEGVLDVPRFGALAGLLSLGAMWAFLSAGISTQRRVLILLIILFVDLFWASFTVIDGRSREEVYAEGAEAAAWLAEHPGRFRIYSPSYSLPQHTAARYGLELAGGVDPLQLEVYADFMAAASGVPRAGYSIPLPPIDGDIASANREAVPDPELLALLNVRFVAAQFDLRIDGLDLEGRFGETRVYRNSSPLGAVWRFPEGFDGNPQPVEPVEFVRQPNRIDLQLDEPGVYFVSEVDYPGWQVLGGTSLPPYQEVFRTFEVTEAGARVSLVFRPVSLSAGMVFFFIGILIVFTLKKRRKHAEEENSI